MSNFDGAMRLEPDDSIAPSLSPSLEFFSSFKLLMDNQVAIVAQHYHYVPNKQDLRDEGHARQCLL